MKRLGKYLPFIIIIIGVIAVSVYILGNQKSNKFEDELINRSKNFYSEVYYPSISEGKSSEEVKLFLGSLSKSGLKINFKNMDRLEIFNKDGFVSEMNDNLACDTEKSHVLLKPIGDLDNESVEVSISFSCKN